MDFNDLLRRLTLAFSEVYGFRVDSHIYSRVKASENPFTKLDLLLCCFDGPRTCLGYYGKETVRLSSSAGGGELSWAFSSDLWRDPISRYRLSKTIRGARLMINLVEGP